jgi:hypothetical protein
MAWRGRLEKTVAFRTFATTLLTVFIYLAILVTTEWQDAPRPAPEYTGEVDLAQALQDLKTVSLLPINDALVTNQQVEVHRSRRVHIPIIRV